MPAPALRLTTLAAAFALAAATPAVAQDVPPGTSSGGLEATVDRPGLEVSTGALLDRTVAIRGRTEAGDAGRVVRIERQLLDATWQPVASTLVEADGAFRVAWRTDQLGRVALRAIVERDAVATAAAAPLTAQLTVFRAATASWYGPGLFGRRTACGIKLTRRTVGVAHRTLPCGTQVQLYHRGRTATVRVIDRGPFVKGRDWDLTHAAAQQLGVKHTARIGFLPPAGVPLETPR
jgi:rare lipoprotein A